MSQGHDGPEKRAGGTGRLRLWIGGIGLLLMIVLILQNQDPVATEVLFWEFRAPLFLLLSMVGGLGLLAGYLLGRRGGRDG